MRILHVVSLIDPEGSFGGPLRVALNQLTTLRDQGHDVLLVAGARGYGSALPTEYDGVPVKAFKAVTAVPGTGFAGLAAPGLNAWLIRHAEQFDAVHVHLARDLVSLPAAAVLHGRKVPYLVQTHGMIDASERSSAKVLDAVLTRRVLQGAQRVLALTSREVADLAEVVPGLRAVQILPNGVPETQLRADVRATPVDVLFLARMAARKHPVLFVEAAQVLAQQFPEVTFSLVGPDEGEVDAVRSRLDEDDAEGRIRYEGALPPAGTLERMARSALYVLPAEHEPFGMTVLEAMSVGLPVVVRSDCGLADEVVAAGGAAAQAGSEALVEAIRIFLTDPARRDAAGAAGLLTVQQFGSAAVATRLHDAYRQMAGDVA